MQDIENLDETVLWRLSLACLAKEDNVCVHSSNFLLKLHLELELLQSTVLNLRRICLRFM